LMKELFAYWQWLAYGHPYAKRQSLAYGHPYIKPIY